MDLIATALVIVGALAVLMEPGALEMALTLIGWRG